MAAGTSDWPGSFPTRSWWPAGGRALYEVLGYGTTGTPLYIDPGHHPRGFLLALCERWPILQLAQWGQAPVDLYLLLSRAAQRALALVAVPVCAGMLWVLAPVLRARRSARFWATGMGLALVPLCAAFPMDRLLLFSSVGAFALVALLAEHAGLWSHRVAAGRRWRRTCALILVVLHGPVAAVLLVGRIVTLPRLGVLMEAAAATAPSDADAARQNYVFVNGQEFPVAYLPVIRQLQQPAAAPRRVALLGSIFQHTEVYREDAATLVMMARGGFLQAPVDQLLRSLDEPFRVGEQIARPDFTATVRSVSADGRPVQVAFRFREPLESRHYRWLAWGDLGAEPFTLAAVGARVELPPVSILPLLRHG